MTTKKSNKSLWIMLALIVAIVVIVLMLPSCGARNKAAEQADATTLIHPGDQAPDFAVEMLDGPCITLSALRGNVVLLNFWATWCPPCREELAQVQTQIIDRFAGRDLVFLPISRGEERATVAAFREKTGYTFAMGLDPTQTIYNMYASNFIPRNFLIDRDGKVILATVGYDAEEFETLIQTIEKTLQ